MKKYDRARLYSRPDLQERGWTKTMMNRHLPDPDDHRDNPYYKCAGAMPLWLRSRVHRIEKNKGFIRDMERANARRAKTAKPFRDPLQTRREREQELIANYLIEGMTEPESTAARQRAIRQARDEFAPADNFYG